MVAMLRLPDATALARAAPHAVGLGRLLRRIRPQSPADMSVGVAARSAARSQRGRSGPDGRSRTLDRPDRGLWAIADQIAAAAPCIAVSATIGALQVLAEAGAPGPRAIRATLERADATLRAARVGCADGASVVALHLDRGAATILWAGDSRAYHCRDGVLTLLTRDHSVAQELIDTGTYPSDRGTPPAPTHVVTRAVGVATGIEIETIAVPVATGDVLMLCSRELSRRLPASMIAGRLRAPVADAADALVEAAGCLGVRHGVSVVAIAVP